MLVCFSSCRRVLRCIGGRALRPQVHKRDFRCILKDGSQQTQFIGVIALQEADEAALHLRIKGAMHLK